MLAAYNLKPSNTVLRVSFARPMETPFTVVNLANRLALYDFLSTFSGTHYVTPRTLTAELGFHF